MKALLLAATILSFHKLNVGDCFQDRTPERWEKQNPIGKIMEVGKSNYRAQYFWWNGTKTDETLIISVVDTYDKVQCPKE